MAKKVITDRKYGIVESYKPSTKSHTGDETPIIGSFSVKGMAVEDSISQNRTKYSKEVWNQKTAFGQAGKFMGESGKLKPSTLFGSIDHPLDNRAELVLEEAAIAWYDITRNEDGSWDGSADILNNPQGKLIKTLLDYADVRGGGELLGVSSRALGESVVSESADGQYEAILPESFELMAFDFVYNPSFQTATARKTESKNSNQTTLVESVRNLAKEDKENKAYYEAVAKQLSAEADVKIEANKAKEDKKSIHVDLHNDQAEELKNFLDIFSIKYEAVNKDSVVKFVLEVSENQEKGFNTFIDKLKPKEEKEVKPKDETTETHKEAKKEEEESTVKKISNGSKHKYAKDIIEESSKDDKEEKDNDKEIDEEEFELDLDGDDLEEDPEDKGSEEDPEDEGAEEDPEDESTDDLREELNEIKLIVQELRDFLLPIEDPEESLEEEEPGDTDEEEEEPGEADEEVEEEETDILDALTEEELDELSDEELNYLLNVEGN